MLAGEQNVIVAGESTYIIRGGPEGRERLRLVARVMAPSTSELLDRVGDPVGVAPPQRREPGVERGRDGQVDLLLFQRGVGRPGTEPVDDGTGVAGSHQTAFTQRVREPGGPRIGGGPRRIDHIGASSGHEPAVESRMVAMASWVRASGRHTDAAVAIVAFSAVKDSMTSGPSYPASSSAFTKPGQSRWSVPGAPRQAQ